MYLLPKVLTTLLLTLTLSGCVGELPPAGTYKKVVWYADTPTGGVSVTYKPAYTERWYAGVEFMVCPVQWMLWDYIDSDGQYVDNACYIGRLAGDPERNRYHGRPVFYDRSPWDPKFYTPVL